MLFGAFNREKLIGFLWIYPRVFIGESRLYINTMIVSAAYRGWRIGKLLVHEPEYYARKNKIYVIDLITASFKTDAIDFYYDLGFKHERVQILKELTNHLN